MVSPLEQQEDEGVADGAQAQQQRAQGDAAQTRTAQQPDGGFQRDGGRVGGRPGAAAGHEEHQDEHAEGGHAGADGEDGVVAVGGAAQDQEGEHRADERTGRVHGPVHAEGPPAFGGGGGKRDQGVARCGAQALAGAVEGEHRPDGGQGVREQQQRFAHGGEPVADAREGLVLTEAVAEVASGEPDQGADAVVEAVEESEAEGVRPSPATR